MRPTPPSVAAAPPPASGSCIDPLYSVVSALSVSCPPLIVFIHSRRLRVSYRRSSRRIERSQRSAHKRANGQTSSKHPLVQVRHNTYMRSSSLLSSASERADLRRKGGRRSVRTALLAPRSLAVAVVLCASLFVCISASSLAHSHSRSFSLLCSPLAVAAVAPAVPTRSGAMSQSDNQRTEPPAEGGVASHAAGQVRMQARDEDCEEKKPAGPSCSHVSPAMRLYRHALESILGMLHLADLSRALCVSREWSAAVVSMAPIVGSIARAPAIPSLVVSPLLRHIATVSSWGNFAPLNNISLSHLAQHAPNLTSLLCTLRLTPDEPLILPVKLTNLDLILDGEHTDATINGMLTVVAALPSLSVLCLYLFSFRHGNNVELSLLAASRSLTDLTLANLDGDQPILSDSQVEQIRSSLGHLHRVHAARETDEIARLLKPPVTARWRDIGHVMADARTGGLLRTLPTLTSVDLWYCQPASHVDFLPQLPFLTHLKLFCYEYSGEEDWFFHTPGEPQTWSVPADALLDSLVLCTGLTHLDLTCGFTPAHWTALLAKLTQLKKLSICRGEYMETLLRCFSSGPITESLESLCIQAVILPPSELVHLSALRRLHSLSLEHCFSARLDDGTIASFTPPTPLLPSLTAFSHQWRITEECRSDHVVHRGPAFEARPRDGRE